MLKIIPHETEREAAITAASIIAERIRKNPTATLGLATGSSPITTYRELARMCRAGELSFQEIRTVNLDEYFGLAPDHEQSYARFMKEQLFDRIDIDQNNTHIPSGIAEDPIAECHRYDQLLKSLGPVDIQLLGIGNNGHIGFNEPSDHFSKATVFVPLTESTIEANSRFFSSREDVPKWAISMGIGQILSAKSIILLAFGQSKAKILADALFGSVTPAVPASILQFYRGELTLIADVVALAEIRENHSEAITA